MTDQLEEPDVHETNFPHYEESETEQAHRTKSEILLRVNDYQIKGTLGRGSYGIVYLVEKDLTVPDGEGNAKKTAFKQYFALKELSSKGQKNKLMQRLMNNTIAKEEKDAILNEIIIMKKLNHPNLVHLREVIREVAPPHTMFIVMEYAKLGNCMRIVSSTNSSESPTFICPLTGGVMGEALASRVFRQVSSAMKYLHKHHIAHRDIKIDNILLDDSGTVRVADFGVSHVFKTDSHLSGGHLSQGLVSDNAGTWPYWSPEICDDENDVEKPYSAYKADVWAAGVCLWVFIFGKLPFWGDTGSLFSQIRKGMPTKPTRVSQELEEVFDRVLTSDPEERPNFFEILNMEWVAQHNAGIMSPRVGPSPRVTKGDLDIENAITGGFVTIKKEYAENLRKWVSSAKEKVANRQRVLTLEAERKEQQSAMTLQAQIDMRASTRSIDFECDGDDDGDGDDVKATSPSTPPPDIKHTRPGEKVAVVSKQACCVMS